MTSDVSGRRGPVEQPWYAYVTIDLLFYVAQRTFLHWFIVWIIPLSLLALGRSIREPSVISTCVYATIVNIVSIVVAIDDRIAFGLPREVDLEEEVVVITGGANGLGLVMAQMLGMQGATVAVLDVEEPTMDDVRGVSFYKCDVGYRDQIQAVAKKIESDVSCSFIPTSDAAV